MNTYRAEDENEEGVSPHAPKVDKATNPWTKILKQQVKSQWYYEDITIHCNCWNLEVAHVEAPRNTRVAFFTHQIRGTITQRSYYKNQCGGDPDEPISMYKTTKHCQFSYVALDGYKKLLHISVNNEHIAFFCS